MANVTYLHMQTDNHSEWSAIEQNCRKNWPRWTCIAANIAGLGSTTLWFLVLLPQLWKNFRRKSVRGLSILWATANFTASLINLFFVFMYVKIPLYGQISSIYCPILEFGLMVQFMVYGNYRKQEKILYAVFCLVVWGAIITLEMLIRLGSVLEYAAIFLWSVETFPQIILNMRLRSTSGQSTISCVIASFGKTTDFIATNGLVMPLQYIIMRYFSSSVAYINGLQVAWYLGNGENVLSAGCFEKNNSGSESSNINESQKSQHSLGNATSPDIQTTSSTTAIINTDGRHMSFMLLTRWICLIILTLLLIGCVVGFVWNVESYLGLLAPIGIMCYLGLTKLYFTKCTRRNYAIQDVHR